MCMKKIINFLVFVFLGILSFSCKNQLVEFTKGYGTVSFGNVSRTVQEKFKEDFSEFTDFVVYARETDSKSEFSVLNEEVTLDSYEAFKNESFTLKVGTYDFYLEAFAGKVKFESDEITAEIKENETTNINFTIYLKDRGTENGTVKIVYQFGENYVTSADFKLSKVEYVDDGKGGKIRTLNNVDVSFEGNDENPEGDWNIWGDPDNPEQENYCIFEKSIPAGQYELTARFESEGDYGTVAEYSTSVSVSEGITSSKEITIENFNPYYAISYTYPEYVNFETDDYPLKYSMYDSISVDDLPRLVNFDDPTETYYSFEGWYTDENFEYPFEGITRYGNMRGDLNLYAKCIIKSKYMMFSPCEDASGITGVYCKMVEDLNNVSFDSIDNFPDTNIVIGGSDIFYYDDVATSYEKNETLTVYNSNISNNRIWQKTFEIGETIYFNDICYDQSTDKIYEIYVDSNENLNFVCINPNDNSFEMFTIPTQSLSFPSEPKFVAYGDTLYAVSMSQTDLFIDIFSIDRENNLITQEDSYTKNNFVDDYTEINDIITVDGKLYILWSYFNEFASVFNEDNISKRVIYSYGGVLWLDENGTINELIYNPTEPIPVTIPPTNTGISEVVNYYGPLTENSNTQLFGPTKFIAIKPKKLVFADEGIFVYNDTDDSDKPKYKNINRVVEIDLNSNSVTTTLVSVEFNEDVDSDISTYSDFVSIQKED